MKAVGKVMLMLFVCALLCGCMGKKNPEAEKAAADAARSWLRLIDEGQYDESWQEAAAFFRNAVPQEQWQDSMKTFREPLGEKRSRQVKSSTYRTSMPGAPDGEYVIIQFKSAFENKEKAIETVTPMLDSDKKWRVSG